MADTSSSLLRLGLARCPHCAGERLIDGVACGFCHGGGRVSMADATKYLWEHRDTDPTGLRIDVEPDEP